MTAEAFGYAFLGGVLPALLWLYFLLREDSRCPEPKLMILVAFFAGMIAVPLVLPLERFASLHLDPGLPVVVAWAAIEEVIKYLAAAVAVLWRWRTVNESPDLVIYMLTAALGFAALENALFLVAPIASGHFVDSLITGNLRFVGSTILHVIASSSIGFALAFSYKSSRAVRMLASTAGLILAITLHTLFNVLIIAKEVSHVLAAFFTVWSAAVVFFALFEILKYLRYRNLPRNSC
ncbi:MAG: PrsW family glutamic-type intramembrane protease [bacterium]